MESRAERLNAQDRCELDQAVREGVRPSLLSRLGAANTARSSGGEYAQRIAHRYVGQPARAVPVRTARRGVAQRLREHKNSNTSCRWPLGPAMVSASPRGLNQRKPGAAAQRRNCRKEKEDDQLAGGEVMYAALVRLTVDPEQASAAAEALMSDILPRVRSASGFVAGYWLEPADGQGFSVSCSRPRNKHARQLRHSAVGPRPESPLPASSFGE
jgi:hypothetical protein